MRISEQEHNERMSLYNQGLTDREIAEKLNRKPSTIAGWRYSNGLASNSEIAKKQSKKSPLAEDAAAARAMGLTYGKWKALQKR